MECGSNRLRRRRFQTGVFPNHQVEDCEHCPELVFRLRSWNDKIDVISNLIFRLQDILCGIRTQHVFSPIVNRPRRAGIGRRPAVVSPAEFYCCEWPIEI